MKNIVISDLGMSTAEVEIIEWKVKEGDFVKEGDEILEIESEKANVLVQSQYTGIITKILLKKGETAAVGSVIATIDEIIDKK
ncbi:MAG: biotin/lipoyl-containing protein [Candidatus Humimicrobiaceae bacterium]